MEYETIIYYDDESGRGDDIVEVHRYQEDLVSWNPTMDPQQSGAPITTRVITRRRTGRVRRRQLAVKQSPRQDATSLSRSGQGPKTRGDTNEFISAFWVNGKPKCRKGYRYDFSRKMCRLIK